MTSDGFSVSFQLAVLVAGEEGDISPGWFPCAHVAVVTVFFTEVPGAKELQTPPAKCATCNG